MVSDSAQFPEAPCIADECNLREDFELPPQRFNETRPLQSALDFAKRLRLSRANLDLNRSYGRRPVSPRWLEMQLQGLFEVR